MIVVGDIFMGVLCFSSFSAHNSLYFSLWLTFLVRHQDKKERIKKGTMSDTIILMRHAERLDRSLEAKVTITTQIPDFFCPGMF